MSIRKIKGKDRRNSTCTLVLHDLGSASNSLSLGAVGKESHRGEQEQMEKGQLCPSRGAGVGHTNNREPQNAFNCKEDIVLCFRKVSLAGV